MAHICRTTITVVGCLLVSSLAQAQFVPSAESLSGLYPGKTYSPYAKRAFPSQVFWGDTHLHTSLSLDAGMFGNTLDSEQAYRFSRGEEVVSSTGLPVKMGRPLDWLVISDHSDLMGFADDFFRGAPNLPGGGAVEGVVRHGATGPGAGHCRHS